MLPHVVTFLFLFFCAAVCKFCYLLTYFLTCTTFALIASMRDSQLKIKIIKIVIIAAVVVVAAAVAAVVVVVVVL